MEQVEALVEWPEDGVIRTPYVVYSDPKVYQAEMKRIFRGPTWHYLGLEVEIPEAGDYRLMDVGDTPVIVLRDSSKNVSALVNRCAHKGTMLLFEPFGNVKELMCVYHNWLYDLDGKLRSIPFAKGINGKGGEVYDRKKMRTGTDELGEFGLHDPSLIDQWDEYGDGITTAIQTTFPNFVLQQIHNTLATRVLVPRGVEGSELIWTILGYADDEPWRTEMRVKQGNLIGPAGYISMEDGMVGSLIQRAIVGDKDKATVMEMAGRSIETILGSRASECGVRGFWTAYRTLMGV